MGNQEWVSWKHKRVRDGGHAHRLRSVVARGYEDEYGPYRRVVQHAL